MYRRGTDVIVRQFYDFVDSAGFHAWTPRVAAQVQASRDTFLYVSPTRGFKSGGFNPSAQRAGLAFAPSSPGAMKVAPSRRSREGGFV